MGKDKSAAAWYGFFRYVHQDATRAVQHVAGRMGC